MPTDTRTTNQNYPKPYPSNLLAEDVLRLRDALDDIDSDMAARVTTTAVQGLIDTAVNNLLAGAPQALDTLNELASALGDDAAFSTTVTAALGARLQLAGGTMTGDIDMGGNAITNFAALNMGGNTVTNAADPVNATDLATKQYADGAGSKGYAFFCGSF